MTEPTPETHDQFVFSTLVHDDENAEELIGDEMIDPWVDPEQNDWPNAPEIEIREEKADE